MRLEAAQPNRAAGMHDMHLTIGYLLYAMAVPEESAGSKSSDLEGS